MSRFRSFCSSSKALGEVQEVRMGAGDPAGCVRTPCFQVGAGPGPLIAPAAGPRRPTHGWLGGGAREGGQGAEAGQGWPRKPGPGAVPGTLSQEVGACGYTVRQWPGPRGLCAPFLGLQLLSPALVAKVPEGVATLGQHCLLLGLDPARLQLRLGLAPRVELAQRFLRSRCLHACTLSRIPRPGLRLRVRVTPPRHPTRLAAMLALSASTASMRRCTCSRAWACCCLSRSWTLGRSGR